MQTATATNTLQPTLLHHSWRNMQSNRANGVQKSYHVQIEHSARAPTNGVEKSQHVQIEHRGPSREKGSGWFTRQSSAQTTGTSFGPPLGAAWTRRGESRSSRTSGRRMRRRLHPNRRPFPQTHPVEPNHATTQPHTRACVWLKYHVDIITRLARLYNHVWPTEHVRTSLWHCE
jgi:hypothetical protein